MIDDNGVVAFHVINRQRREGLAMFQTKWEVDQAGVSSRYWSVNWLCLLLVLLWSGVAFGQGAAREDRADVQAQLQPYTPAPRPDQRPAIVDLRGHLPRVGLQTMNDCVGWAYGYAARTYMEAVDQNWQPTQAARIFSPTFIYNQINEGKDRGSSPIKAVQLLRDKGIATLQTQPYLAKDFKSPVNAKATKEAEVFRIADFRVARNGEMVRDALAAGEIVCIGVRTNPVFSSGRYDVYTTKHHKDGTSLRRDGQPHGFHAMVIAGYDDNRRAFLLMNSWGLKWGNNGYVWVSYDVADKFNLRESTEQLIDYAIVMEDRHEPVVPANKTYSLFEADKLSVNYTSSVAGFNAQDQPQYDVKFQLIGTLPEMSSVEHVMWHYHDGIEEKEYKTFWSRPAMLRTTKLEQKVRAEVELKSGRRVDLSVPLTLPTLVPHRVELERIDALVHVVVKEQPQFRWTLVPQMSATDWAALDRIEWTVTVPTQAQNPNLRPELMPLSTKNGNVHRVTYQHNQSSQPLTSTPTLAYPSDVSHVVPAGFARFVFRDGQKIDVKTPADPYPPVVGNGVSISHVQRPVGIFAGEEWYFVEIKVTIPEASHRYLRGAKFVMDGLGSDRDNYVGKVTTGLEPLGYVFHTYASRTFNAYGSVFLKNGTDRRMLTAAQLFAWDWQGELTFSTLKEQVQLTPLAAEFRLRDWYLGIDAAGKPRWRFEPYMIETRPLYSWYEYWNHDSWQFDQKDVKVIDQHKQFPELYGVFVEAGEGVTMTVPASLVRRVNGEETPPVAHDFKVPLVPQSPPTTGLSLRVIEHTPNRLFSLERPPTQPLIEVDLRGGRWEMRQVSRVDFLVPRAGGWVQAVRVDVPNLKNASEDLSVAILERPGNDSPVRAIVRLSNGGVMALETPVMGWLPYSPPPQTTLSAISRYWGTENGRPTWRVELRIDGQLDAISKINSVVFTAVDEGGVSRTVQPADARSAMVMTDAPLRVHATVTFNDGREVAELDATVLTPADTILPDGQLKMRIQHLHTRAAVIDRLAENAFDNYEDPIDYWAARLQAPLKDLERVREVRYRVDGFWKTFEPAIAQRAGQDPGDHTLPRDVFAHALEFMSLEDDESVPVVHGVIVLKDGTELAEQSLPSTQWREERTQAKVEVQTEPWSQAEHKYTMTLLAPEALDEDRAHLSATYQWSTGSDAKLAKEETSYGWPHSPLSMQCDGPIVLQKIRLNHLENENVQEETVDLQPLAINPPAYRPDALRVETTADGYHIIPDYNGQFFHNVATLWYEVHVNNQSQRIDPIAWIGTGPERFTAKRTGPKPSRIVMHIKTINDNDIAVEITP